MPYRDAEVGKAHKREYYRTHTKDKYIRKCIDCGKEEIVSYNPKNKRRCNSCAMSARVHPTGKDSHFWKGGKFNEHTGYTLIFLDPTSPYYSMGRVISKSKQKYIYEHRLIMAEHLGRCLAVNEHVHHINGIKTDNRLENLQLMSRNDHIAQRMFCFKCNLRRDIRLLHWQIKEQTEQIRLLTAKLMGIE